MKTSELTGALLDYWVATAEGLEPYADKLPDGATYHRYWLVDLPEEPAVIVGLIPEPPKGAVRYAPSSLWQQGGPIIEREAIDIACTEPRLDPRYWLAQYNDSAVIGETPLIAAMRAYVESKLGYEVPGIDLTRSP